MTFKEYFLRESPDRVFDVNKQELSWASDDAYAFGWMAALPGIKPFLIHSMKEDKSSSWAHMDIVREFFGLFGGFDSRTDQNSWSAKTKPADVLTKYYHQGAHDSETVTSIRLRTVPAFPQLLQSICTNKQLYKDLVTRALFGRLEQGMGSSSYRFNKGSSRYDFFGGDDSSGSDTSSGSDETAREGAAVLAQATAFLRTKVLKNAGRIWLDSKIISFWNTTEQIPIKIIEEVFSAFNIPVQDRENFLVDIIDPKHITKEGTKEKVLSSYSEYKNRKSIQKPVDKNTEKKIAELLATQHGQAGAQKAKLGKEIPPVGAERYAQKAPLDVRQKAMTSEGIL